MWFTFPFSSLWMACRSLNEARAKSDWLHPLCCLIAMVLWPIFLFNSFLVTTINFSQFLLYYVILKINIVKICFLTRSIKILRIVLSVTGSLYSTVHILKKHTDNANYKWISIINSMGKVFVGLSWFFFSNFSKAWKNTKI